MKISPPTWRFTAASLKCEGNQVVVRDGKIFINGKETDEYTFRDELLLDDGDNRHNSEDSGLGLCSGRPCCGQTSYHLVLHQ